MQQQEMPSVMEDTRDMFPTVSSSLILHSAFSPKELMMSI
jgi:hypothetical protein